MKTLSEHHAAKREAKKNRRERHLEDLRSVLAQTRDVEAFQNEQGAIKLRNMIKTITESDDHLNGQDITTYEIVCDTCGTQLVNPQPGRQLLSYPPQQHIQCAGCGWSGYVTP